MFTVLTSGVTAVLTSGVALNLFLFSPVVLFPFMVLLVRKKTRGRLVRGQPLSGWSQYAIAASLFTLLAFFYSEVIFEVISKDSIEGFGMVSAFTFFPLFVLICLVPCGITFLMGCVHFMKSRSAPKLRAIATTEILSGLSPFIVFIIFSLGIL